jgi:hypothetical protein
MKIFAFFDLLINISRNSVTLYLKSITHLSFSFTDLGLLIDNAANYSKADISFI